MIQGNYLGAAPTGRLAMGNSVQGTEITFGFDNNTIGDTSPGSRKIICETFQGIRVVFSTGNLIQVNYDGEPENRKHGDICDIEISEIGILRNPVQWDR